MRVRSAAEIFATLDDRGTLDGLPFMPEMLKYCGRTLPVTQRADATCAGDGLVRIDARRRPPAEHPLRRVLPRRLPGRMPDVLERGLARAGRGPRRRPSRESSTKREQAFVDETLIPATQVEREDAPGPDLYRCQATEIKQASRQMRVREFDQYVARPAQLEAPEAPARPVRRGDQPVAGRSAAAACRGGSGSPGGERFPFVLGKLEKGTTPKGEPLESAAGRSRPDQEQARDRRHARQGQPEPRPVLRPRDGELLRPHRSRAQPRDPPDRGVERRDGRDQVRLHRPRGRRLRRATSTASALAAIYSLLARDLAREDRRARGPRSRPHPAWRRRWSRATAAPSSTRDRPA